MAASRYMNVGLRATRQVFFGTMDMALHATPDEPDMEAAMRESWQVCQLPYPEDTFMLAGFGHLMGGYDAGYYGYLWAEVIGDDMWGRFAEEGITSPEVGCAIPPRDPGAERREERRRPGGRLPGTAGLDRDFLRMRGHGLHRGTPRPAEPAARPMLIGCCRIRLARCLASSIGGAGYVAFLVVTSPGPRRRATGTCWPPFPPPVERQRLPSPAGGST